MNASSVLPMARHISRYIVTRKRLTGPTGLGGCPNGYTRRASRGLAVVPIEGLSCRGAETRKAQQGCAGARGRRRSARRGRDRAYCRGSRRGPEAEVGGVDRRRYARLRDLRLRPARESSVPERAQQEGRGRTTTPPAGSRKRRSGRTWGRRGKVKVELPIKGEARNEPLRSHQDQGPARNVRGQDQVHGRARLHQGARAKAEGHVSVTTLSFRSQRGLVAAAAARPARTSAHTPRAARAGSSPRR